MILFLALLLIFVTPFLAFWRKFYGIAILSLIVLIGAGFEWKFGSSHPMGFDAPLFYVPAVILGILIDGVCYFWARNKAKKNVNN